MLLRFEKCVKVKSPDNCSGHRQEKQDAELQRQPSKQDWIRQEGYQDVINKEIDDIEDYKCDFCAFFHKLLLLSFKSRCLKNSRATRKR